MSLADFMAGQPVTYWSGGLRRRKVVATWLRNGQPVPYLSIAGAGGGRKAGRVMSRPIMGAAEAESFYLGLERFGCII